MNLTKIRIKMITQKTKEEIESLREGGKRLALVLDEMRKIVSPGVSLRELNSLGEKIIREGGDTPSFLNYKPDGAPRAYPASICISVNDEIVHGIPNEGDRVLEEGDIVTLDAGVTHNGMIVDAAITVPVGEVSLELTKLMDVTRGARDAGIQAAHAGARIGDISNAIEEYVKPHGFSIYKELVGHGVGYSVHEDPYIPNFGKKGVGTELSVGNVLAIEPMFGLGSDQITLDGDGYTYRTKDGSASAHFEHTIVITEDGPEVLTAL